MATCTSVATGDWSAGATWDTDPVIPVNGDTVIIANTHTVTFDEDMSGWADGVTLTINTGGTLQADTAAGSYYLKCQADLTNNGTLRAGTDTTTFYPSTCDFEINFNSAGNSIECADTGYIYFYCAEPTNTYVKLSAQEAAGQTILSVDTDVTADIWAAADDVVISDDNNGLDIEKRIIAGGGIAANTITITVALAAQKESGAYIFLQTRNVRVSGSTSYAVKDVAAGSYVGAELDCTHGSTGSDSVTWAGTITGGSSSTSYGLINCQDATVSGVVTFCGYGYYLGNGATISGCIAGCTNGVYQSHGILIPSTGLIEGCTYGMFGCGASVLYGTVEECANGIYTCSGMTISGTLDGNSNDLRRVHNVSCYNTSFTGATENADYDSVFITKSDYTESSDHDQTANAYRAWCRGGTVVSQTASPPTGYTIWYELTAEDTTQTYPVFRQFQTTVLAGTSLEVDGKIRIADGEDLTGYAPALQIIDYYADPLVDSSNSVLDEDPVDDPSGATADWQDVSVIWANQGDTPRTVLVRMIAWNDGGVDDVIVDGVWAVANYQDQIASIYGKLPTNYIMGSSDVNDHDTDIDAILVDTNEIQGKLPTNYIMGSSVVTDKDDEIDDIQTILRPISTTVATEGSTTSCTLTAGVATADAYNGMSLFIKDAGDSHWEERRITDWTAGRVVTVNAAFSFTPTVGDVAYILGTAYGGGIDTILNQTGQVHQTESTVPGDGFGGRTTGVAEGC